MLMRTIQQYIRYNNIIKLYKTVTMHIFASIYWFRTNKLSLIISEINYLFFIHKRPETFDQFTRTFGN